MKHDPNKYPESHSLYWQYVPNKDTLDKYWKAAIPRSKYLVERLKDIDFNSIYEVGFFSGRNLHYIRRQFPDVRIGGADICRAARGYASRKVEGAELEILDVEKLRGEKWDVVFTMGTLIHVPNIDKALKKCAAKASKYIIHIEANGDDYIFCGPEELRPEANSKRFEWFPNIYKRYQDMGLDVSCEEMPKDVWARDCSHFIIVKL